MVDEKPPARAPATSTWASLLFGDDPWPMLLALLACGMLIFILARDAVPAILAVVLAGVAAHAWLMRRADGEAEAEAEAEQEERS